MGLLNKNYCFDTKDLAIKSILKECYENNLLLYTQKAYILATVEHETAGQFRPVIEAFWQSEQWRKEHFRYYPYYGRGLVQVTWKDNYELFTKIIKEKFKINIDLVKNPELALDNDIATFILCYGFANGSFTNQKITDFIDESGTDFYSARKCINGLDQADRIKEKAEYYLSLLAG